MGKAGRNEMKRVGANFLNGAAVALLMAGYIGPMVARDSQLWVALITIIGSVTMHSLAVRLASGLED